MLQDRAAAGNHGATAAIALQEEPNRFLATVQVGISLIGTFAAAFGGDVFAEPLVRVFTPLVGAAAAEVIALILVVLGITYLSLIIGELVPKRLGLLNADAVAASLEPTMRALSRVAAPIVWLLTVSTQAVLTLLGRGGAVEEAITEADVLSLVREGAVDGTVDAAEQDLIERVFRFTDRTVRTIMTPRTDIVALPDELPLAEATVRVLDSGYSRVPVYHDTMDSIVGVLYVKDLLRALVERPVAAAAVPLAQLVRPPVYVLQHQRIAEVLTQFRATQTHQALVLDEYGQVDGLVTLEDILEELTGEIADEYDERDPPILKREDGSYLVDGQLPYGDAVDALGLPPTSVAADLPDFETVAGLVLAVLERLPVVGDHMQWQDWTFEVVDMDGVRIDKLLVRPPGGTPAPDAPTEDGP